MRSATSAACIWRSSATSAYSGPASNSRPTSDHGATRDVRRRRSGPRPPRATSEANHPPVVKLDHPALLTARPGERVDLSATGSSDPDGDALSFEWFCYEEPGTRRMSNSSTGVKHDIVAFDQSKAWLRVKTARVVPPGAGTMHIILAVTDHGTPRLTRYARVIIDVVP